MSASEDTGLQRGMDCEILHRLGRRPRMRWILDGVPVRMLGLEGSGLGGSHIDWRKE